MKQVLVGATISVDPDLLGFRLIGGGRSEWITVAETAAALGMSARHIRRLCAKGELRHKRLGKLYRVHTSELVRNKETPRAVLVPPAPTSTSASEPPADMVDECVVGSRPSSQPASAASRAPVRPVASASEVMRSLYLNKATGLWETRRRPAR